MDLVWGKTNDSVITFLKSVLTELLAQSGVSVPGPIPPVILVNISIFLSYMTYQLSEMLCCYDFIVNKISLNVSLLLYDGFYYCLECSSCIP